MSERFMETDRATFWSRTAALSQPDSRSACRDSPLVAHQLLVDRFDALDLEAFKVVLHSFENFGWMRLPVGDFSNDLQRIAGSVGAGRVARESLVGEVGVVFDGTGRFDLVDAAWSLANGQLGSPDGGIQGGGEIDIVGLLLSPKVGGAASLQKATWPQNGLGAVVERPFIGDGLAHLSELTVAHRPG